MNYLAHLLLAGSEPEARVGNLLGDFCRGVDLEALDSRIRQGVELHWAVDRFTDAHPVVLESRRRLREPFRRYSGVLIDVFYDHFLARDWERFHPQVLPDYAQEVYQSLRGLEPTMPERMRRVCAVMAEQDWLCSYAEVDGIRSVLERMGRRMRRENALAEAAGELEAHYATLGEDFHQFFPELQQFVRQGNGGRRRRAVEAGYNPSGEVR